MPKQPEPIPENLGFWQFWGQAVSHSFTKAWLGVIAMTGVLGVLVSAARLFARDNVTYQAFVEAVEKYWAGYIFIGAFLLILVGRLIYAPFLIYKQRERQSKEELEAAQNESESRKKQLASLSGLRGHIIHRAYFKDNQDRAGVVVALRITNRGEPTIVDGWTLLIDLNGCAFEFGATHSIYATIDIPGEMGKTAQLKSSEMLYEKVGTNPIAKGGRVSGFLVFLTKGIPFEHLDINQPPITILFRDAFGQDYRVDQPTVGETSVFYEPGLDDPFAPLVLRQKEIRRKLLESVREKIKDSKSLLAALLQANADEELDTNDELSALCDDMKSAGLGHPFEREVGAVLPKTRWLELLKNAREKGVNLNDRTHVYKYLLVPMALGKSMPP
jgi:hypothetical protein